VPRHISKHSQPLRSTHILQTKGKTVKKNTINYEAIKYGKAVTKSIQQQLGKGVRLTVGKYCDKPITHEDNIRMFEELDKEKKLKEQAAAAIKRRKDKDDPVEGDEKLIEDYEALVREEFLIEYSSVKEKAVKGEVLTKTESKFMQSRKVKEHEARLRGGPVGKGKQAGIGRGRGRGKGKGRGRGRGKGRGQGTRSDSDSDADSDSSHEADDLVGETFVDEGQTCTVTGVGYDSDGEAVAMYMFDGEKEYSGAGEVREWVEANKKQSSSEGAGTGTVTP